MTPDEDEVEHDTRKPVSKRERNKISASKYRKRRKVYMKDLEQRLGSLDETVEQQRNEISVLSTENSVLRRQLSMLQKLVKGVQLPFLPEAMKRLIGSASPSSSSSTASDDSDCASDVSLELSYPAFDEEDSDNRSSTSSHSPNVAGIGAGLMMFSVFALLASSPELPADPFRGSAVPHTESPLPAKAGRTICALGEEQPSKFSSLLISLKEVVVPSIQPQEVAGGKSSSPAAAVWREDQVVGGLGKQYDQFEVVGNMWAEASTSALETESPFYSTSSVRGLDNSNHATNSTSVKGGTLARLIDFLRW